MKRITVTLTEDQLDYLITLADYDIANTSIAYKPEYVEKETAFARRVKTSLVKAKI